MRRLVALFVLSAVVACGGRESNDIDAESPDASFDIDAHWGECCDRTQGGLGRPCTTAEIAATEAGVDYQRFPCGPSRYCGLDVQAGGLPFVGCCGHKALQASSAEIDLGCPPWPGEVEASWGDCCYQGSAPDGSVRYGGVRGPCPVDTPYPHTQCSANRYCGRSPDSGLDSGFAQACCGDRSNDQGTIEASGVDPDCVPQYWEP